MKNGELFSREAVIAWNEEFQKLRKLFILYGFLILCGIWSGGLKEPAKKMIWATRELLRFEDGDD